MLFMLWQTYSAVPVSGRAEIYSSLSLLALKYILKIVLRKTILMPWTLLIPVDSVVFRYI